MTDPRLARALQDAARSGGVALWWRDDDAARGSGALDRLLALARRYGLPVVLAVIPDRVDDSLAEALAEAQGVAVAVHGIAHANRAAAGQKKQELVAADDSAAQPLLAALKNARHVLARRFPGRALPLLVPPWNRIDAPVVQGLRWAGFAALSTFGTRAEAAGTGLYQLNPEVDLMDWRRREGRPYPDVAAALADAIDARVTGRLPGPVGLLTHHLQHDETAWATLEAVLADTAAAAGVSWPAPDALFARLAA
ncbi:polysaccharide deacetylase family protein [Futiania mangrovi]|uniref:Polysaccharide deacetylase n=1 Tax=Futiania mangrovi TaxID=2959716 RepID=A0A9J6PBF5_9PROT|nr:polysaccharide deacetylase [Futiania mangrovii]MCP1336533.1 polysaccharide deacetylase [Futiania mangrovii]